MGRPCGVCSSSSHLAIDRALLQRQPLATIGRKHNQSPAALSRHAKAHLHTKPVALKDLADDGFESFKSRVKLDGPADVLEFARFQFYRLEKIVDQAHIDGDLRTAVAAINSTLKTTTELFAKTSGLLSDGAPADHSTRILTVLSGVSDDDLRAFLGRQTAPRELEA